jgi:hypothetical protein
VGRRLRTRDELLAVWRAEAELAAAAVNERGEVEASARIDAEDPRLGLGPMTPDVVVKVWAAETLSVEFAPGDRVPPQVRAAFDRAQRLLWDGEPIAGGWALVDDEAVMVHCEG